MDGRITYPAFSTNQAHSWTAPQRFTAAVNFSPTTNAAPNVGDIWFSSARQTLATGEGANGNELTVYKSGIIAMQTAYQPSITPVAANTYYPLYVPSDYTGNLLLPSGFWVVGKTVEIECVISAYATAASNSIAVTPTMTSILGSNAVGVTIPAYVATMLKLRATLTCSAVGVSGTASLTGYVELYSMDHGTTINPMAQTINWSTQFDTTVANTLGVNYQESVALQITKQSMKVSVLF